MQDLATEFQRLAAEAVDIHRSGQLEQAEAAYRKALGIQPGHPVVTHNLGVVLAARGDHQGAAACFDRAIKADPQYASAHFNRGVALQVLGEDEAALQAFIRTCAIEPEHYAAHRALAFAWLAAGHCGRALDHFARTYELRRGEDRSGIAAPSLTSATQDKLLHDAEQFRYLAGRRRDGQRFEILARLYLDVAKDLPREATPLADEQLDQLGQDYNTAINVWSAPEMAGRAVNERDDRDVIMQRFRAGGAGATFFDDLLTPQALTALRRFLLESTIWHDFSHIGGFVASYLEDGLACPLVLQIANELRSTLPEVLGPHPLSQAWAFKGLKGEAAIDAHADDGLISVNFWVTPDEANLDPDSGGLLVCRTPPPSGWQMRGYDADRDEVIAFLQQNAGNTLKAAYRDNRAVLFESQLFHRSDGPKFKSGYEEHRINLTMLFGRS